MNGLTIVLYTSKYGTTEKYARWIAEAAGCPAKRLQDVRAQELEAYDTILYGGGVYVGSVAGFQKFLKMLGSAKNKKLGVFMVGLSDLAEADAYKKIAEQTIPPEWQPYFTAFALRGDQLFSKMSAMHKVMMRMPRAAAMKKPVDARTQADQFFIESFGKDITLSSKEQITPILTYLQQAECGRSKAE